MLPREAGTLTSDQIESLRRAAAAGAGMASEAISLLTRLTMEPTAPRVRALPLHQVPETLGGPDAEMVAIHLAVEGAARGNLLIALAPDDARTLLSAMLPDQPLPGALDALSELQQSGLLELGNVLAAAYLNAVSGLASARLVPSIPRLAIDMAGAVVDLLLVEMTHGHDAALVIQTEMSCPGSGVRLRILLLPDPATLPGVLTTLKAR